MNERFQIRLATSADADPIAWLRARMFQDMGQIPPHLFDSFRIRARDRLHELLESGEYIGWLASTVDAPDKIIAGAGVHRRLVLPHPHDDQDFAEGRQAVIINVFTEPDWRRRGLGALLLARIVEWSRQQKLDRLLLHASEQGRGLYERLGFIPTNEMKYAGDPSTRS